MRVCVECYRCYDDSDIYCPEEGHPALSHFREGSPDLIPGYRLDSLLESGVKGEVYSAHQTTCHGPCIIRIFSAAEEKCKLFVIEAERAAAFFHPNVVDVYEAGFLDTGDAFVVSEAADGTMLRELLDVQARPEILTTVQAIRQTAEALHALHVNGLTHGAVNPENIIMTNDAQGRLLVRIKDLDHGSFIEHALISSRSLIGADLQPLRYFAPEQCSGSGGNVGADIYSLGVVMYEMLAGAPPFTASKAVGLMEQHRHQTAPEISIDSFNLRMLLTHSLKEALQKQPKMRQSSANAFARQMRHMEQLATHTSVPPPAMVVPTVPRKPIAVGEAPPRVYEEPLPVAVQPMATEAMVEWPADNPEQEMIAFEAHEAEPVLIAVESLQPELEMMAEHDESEPPVIATEQKGPEPEMFAAESFEQEPEMIPVESHISEPVAVMIVVPSFEPELPVTIEPEMSAAEPVVEVEAHEAEPVMIVVPSFEPELPVTNELELIVVEPEMIAIESQQAEPVSIAVESRKSKAATGAKQKNAKSEVIAGEVEPMMIAVETFQPEPPVIAEPRRSEPAVIAAEPLQQERAMVTAMYEPQPEMIVGQYQSLPEMVEAIPYEQEPEMIAAEPYDTTPILIDLEHPEEDEYFLADAEIRPTTEAAPLFAAYSGGSITSNRSRAAVGAVAVLVLLCVAGGVIINDRSGSFGQIGPEAGSVVEQQTLSPADQPAAEQPSAQIVTEHPSVQIAEENVVPGEPQPMRTTSDAVVAQIKALPAVKDIPSTTKEKDTQVTASDTTARGRPSKAALVSENIRVVPPPTSTLVISYGNGKVTSTLESGRAAPDKKRAPAKPADLGRPRVVRNPKP